MDTGLDLVFQYFFAAGAAVGMGLMLSVIPSLVIYKLIVRKIDARRR